MLGSGTGFTLGSGAETAAGVENGNLPVCKSTAGRLAAAVADCTITAKIPPQITDLSMNICILT